MDKPFTAVRDEVRRQGATEEDIQGWWSLSAADRVAIIEDDEAGRLAAVRTKMDEGMTYDQATAWLQRHWPTFAMYSPRKRYGRNDPLPYEMRSRAIQVAQALSTPPRIPRDAPSMNAFLRRPLAPVEKPAKLTAARIKRDYRRLKSADLPISGGGGQSRKDAIVIARKKDYVSVEYAVLNFLADMRGVSFEVVEQALLGVGDRKVDQIKVAWANDPDNYYNLYFDVTAALSPSPAKKRKPPTRTPARRRTTATSRPRSARPGTGARR